MVTAGDEISLTNRSVRNPDSLTLLDSALVALHTIALTLRRTCVGMHVCGHEHGGMCVCIVGQGLKVLPWVACGGAPPQCFVN